MGKKIQGNSKFSVVTFSKPASKMTGGGGGNVPEYFMFPGSGGFGLSNASKNMYG